MEWWFWKWLGEGWITMLYVASEIYFPHWIYKRLELNQEPRLRSIKNESDKEMVRKLVIVSLWCIQTDPSNRPAMSRVVDMMEGSMESLQIPPKPYLSSPPRSPPRPSDHNTYTSHTTYPSENWLFSSLINQHVFVRIVFLFIHTFVIMDSSLKNKRCSGFSKCWMFENYGTKISQFKE